GLRYQSGCSDGCCKFGVSQPAPGWRQLSRQLRQRSGRGLDAFRHLVLDAQPAGGTEREICEPGGEQRSRKLALLSERYLLDVGEQQRGVHAAQFRQLQLEWQFRRALYRHQGKHRLHQSDNPGNRLPERFTAFGLLSQWLVLELQQASLRQAVAELQLQGQPE